jgi:hypothetical protein
LKLYNVVGDVSNFSSVKHTIAVFEIEDVKETKSNYMWEGRRLPKEEVGKLKNIGDSANHISYRIITMDDGIEDAKKRVMEAVKEMVEKKLAIYQGYKLIVEIGQPEDNFYEDDLAKLRKKKEALEKRE